MERIKKLTKDKERLSEIAKFQQYITRPSLEHIFKA